VINLNNPPMPLIIGRQGENQYCAIEFDVFDWLTQHPNGVVSVVFDRPDGERYVVVAGAVTSPVVWTPSATDTAVAGNGRLELRISVDNMLGKSTVIQTTTIASIYGDGAVPSPPEPDWTQEVANNAGLAARAADRAEQSAELAQGAAEQTANDRQAVAGDRTIVEGKTAKATEEADRAEAEADDAEESKTDAERAKAAAQQALSDLLHMLGTDIATLTDGKLTPSQIPALSINDVFPVASEVELLTLTAERGDTALVMGTDGDDNSIVTDSYILAADDPTLQDNWKKLGISYVANAGHASTADNAVNADKINNKRMVAMTQSQYDTAVLDDNTFYIVTPDEV
jgi:hypothetical protein